MTYDRARSDQRQQHVLVDGQVRFTVVVTVMVFAEPVRERRVDPAHGFAKHAAHSAAPPQPELFDSTAANRSSVAPAQRAVLPIREWPATLMRRRSMAGSVSR